MYDDFVKRKDMKREGYSSGSLHSFTTNGGSTRYTLPVSTGVGGGGGGGGGGVGGMGTLDGGAGGGSGGGVKFDRHDPRQVCVVDPTTRINVVCFCKTTDEFKSDISLCCNFFFFV